MWFNSSFNLKAKTKIDKLLLNLLDKHFPPHNKLHKLFNRNNVKISYSCMPNMNSYTYMHNHKVLNDKPNETGINNCNCRNEDDCPLPNTCQTKYVIFQGNIDLTSLDITKNVTLAHVKQHLKIVLGITKSRSTTLNIKMIRNYQKNFGKSKSAMEHQKLHGKLSEYVPLTTQTVSAAFYI